MDKPKNRFSFMEYKPGLDPTLAPKIKAGGNGLVLGAIISAVLWAGILYLVLT